MASIDLNINEMERLVKAMQDYEGNTEQVINKALHHGETYYLAQDHIRFLMPVSWAKWKGKKPAARVNQNSLQRLIGNLSLTVKSSTNYNYLYFPDDGTNTTRHIGNQRFFERGGEAATPEIIDRCIGALVETFESEV